MYSVHNCQRQKQEFTKTGKISKMTQKGNIQDTCNQCTNTVESVM